LAEGKLVGEEVICPWHGAHFNVKTGAVCAPPAREGVKSYTVRVSENDVEVEII
jgi:3-phenylpropionate/trans-cinnamate dioxygenase ferredoxin subunit